MRSRWLRFLPLFVAAIWLPFQAIAATAMPFCRHGEAPVVAAMDDIAAEHCHMHDQQAPADHGLGCDHCGFCHLAAAGVMPTSERFIVIVPAGRDFRSEAPLAPASNIPEPPQQPPRRLA